MGLFCSSESFFIRHSRFLRNIPETDVVPEVLEPDGNPLLILLVSSGTPEQKKNYVKFRHGGPESCSGARAVPGRKRKPLTVSGPARGNARAYAGKRNLRFSRVKKAGSSAIALRYS